MTCLRIICHLFTFKSLQHRIDGHGYDENPHAKPTSMMRRGNFRR